jgi:hypothetical protein
VVYEKFVDPLGACIVFFIAGVMTFTAARVEIWFQEVNMHSRRIYDA